LSVWSKFSGLNTRKHGKGDAETVKRVDDIKINVGSGGLLNRAGQGLEQDYTQIRASVTVELIKHITDVAKVSKTKTQFFTRLDDDGVSLRVLVALGVCTEESIAAYRTLRKRGLNALDKEEEDLQRVDEAYALEIFNQEEGYPYLLDADGNRLEDQVTMNELIDRLIAEKADLLRKISNQRIENIENAVNDQFDEQASINMRKRSETEIVNIDFNVFDEGSLTDEALEDLKAEEKVADDWRSVLDNLKTKIEDDTQKEKDLVTKYEQALTEKNEELVSEIEEEIEKLETPKNEVRLKEIYIISPVFEIEPIEGYSIKFITDATDFSYFTTSRDNLLLLTDNIPRYLVTMFLEWIKCLAEKNLTYRVAKLEGTKLVHKLIEGEVTLTKVSLDNYYETHVLSNYVGSGLGDFQSISKSLLELQDLEETMEDPKK
jgi:hypothetical protein